MQSVHGLKLTTIMAALAMLPSLEGRAASFACAKASTPHERHLCADPILNAADGRMGQSYQAASKSFPLQGFVRASQQRFLIGYVLCDAPGGKSCKSVIEDRINDLEAMRNSLVYSDGTPGSSFSPDYGVFWLSRDRNPPVIHYFGGFMPDMNVPEPFPRGFVCDDKAALRKTETGWTGIDAQDAIVVTDQEVRAEISCSPRNGLRGTFKRVGQASPAPAFEDPTALVAWLLQRSGHGFDPFNDATNGSVFSPGLRAGVHDSLVRSRQRNEPPCGADGDFIRDTQEDGTPRNVRLSAQVTAADRRTVSASYDVDGYHRDRRFMTVMLDGSWKLENIVEANGTSLRRSLDCRS